MSSQEEFNLIAIGDIISVKPAGRNLFIDMYCNKYSITEYTGKVIGIGLVDEGPNVMIYFGLDDNDTDISPLIIGRPMPYDFVDDPHKKFGNDIKNGTRYFGMSFKAIIDFRFRTRNTKLTNTNQVDEDRGGLSFL